MTFPLTHAETTIAVRARTVTIVPLTVALARNAAMACAILKKHAIPARLIVIANRLLATMTSHVIGQLRIAKIVLMTAARAAAMVMKFATAHTRIAIPVLLTACSAGATMTETAKLIMGKDVPLAPMIARATERKDISSYLNSSSQGENFLLSGTFLTPANQ